MSTAPQTGQEAFRAALLDAGRAMPEGLTDGAGRPAGRRFSVYRNNVAVSLTEALETGFPCVARIVGPENFAKVAGLFLRTHPPASPLMMYHGAALPGFLETFAPLKSAGYLPDVARLELALRESYHAADADPVAPDALAALPPEALLSARVALAPSLRLLRSRWPVQAIWSRYMADGPDPASQAQDVVILRPGFDPAPHLLPPGGHAFLAALQAGATFGAAHDAGLREAAAFDLGGLLALLLSGGGIVDLLPEECP